MLRGRGLCELVGSGSSVLRVEKTLLYETIDVIFLSCSFVDECERVRFCERLAKREQVVLHDSTSMVA